LEKYPDVKRLALSIDEVCASGNFSRSFYESEKRAGRGPRELHLGKARRVRPSDAESWLASYIK
jgi:hypothetical protein